MLFPLIKKDFLIIKKQAFILICIVVGLPFLMFSQTHGGGVVGLNYYFFALAIMSIFMIYLQLSNTEEQYKGSAFLCATPYTRKKFVEAKYLFIVVAFVGITFIQIILAIFYSPIRIGLTWTSVSGTFLVLSLFLGTLIPLQIKFGNKIAVWILMITTLAIPVGTSTFIKWTTNHIHLSITLPYALQMWLPVAAGVLIGIISLIISQKIYANKDL
jgi:hypothetical protein